MRSLAGRLPGRYRRGCGGSGRGVPGVCGGSGAPLACPLPLPTSRSGEASAAWGQTSRQGRRGGRERAPSPGSWSGGDGGLGWGTCVAGVGSGKRVLFVGGGGCGHGAALGCAVASGGAGVAGAGPGELCGRWGSRSSERRAWGRKRRSGVVRRGRAGGGTVFRGGRGSGAICWSGLLRGAPLGHSGGVSGAMGASCGAAG